MAGAQRIAFKYLPLSKEHLYRKLVVKSRKIFRLWGLLPFAILLIGIFFILRYPTDRDTLKVFYHSGTNVFELLKTFDHFRNDPDPRKMEAAKYLIRNMDLYYHRENPYSDMVIRWAAKQNDLDKEELEQAIAGIKMSWDSMRNEHKTIKIRDCRRIKSEMLIGHIDQAFSIWDRSPWKRHFSFEQFCDHLLSYKTNHAKPRLWLEDYSNKYRWIFDSIGMERDLQESISLAFEVTETPFRSYYLDIGRHLDPLEMEALLTGDCTVHADWRGYVMRSLGAPVGNIYTPV